MNNDIGSIFLSTLLDIPYYEKTKKTSLEEDNHIKLCWIPSKQVTVRIVLKPLINVSQNYQTITVERKEEAILKLRKETRKVFNKHDHSLVAHKPTCNGKKTQTAKLLFCQLFVILRNKNYG